MANNNVKVKKVVNKSEELTQNEDYFRNKKWIEKSDWLDYQSIKTYLAGSIGAKKSSISNHITFEQKIHSVDLGCKLRGIEVFLKEYWNDGNTPYDLVNFCEKLRTENDKTKIAKFVQLIDDFPAWMVNERPRKLSNDTAVNYQAMLRGNLTWNHFNFKFKNLDEPTEKEQRKHDLDIDFDLEVEMGFKLIEYVSDFGLKLWLKWMQISGLGSKEIRTLKFSNLRRKNYDKEFVKIQQRRKKSNIRFTTFVYGDVKRMIQKWLRVNEDANDEDWLFRLTPMKAYHKYEQMFTNAYNRMIKQEYPHLVGESKVFSMHSYRGIFCTISANYRVPKYIEDIFVGHKSKNKLDKNYMLFSDEELLKNFKIVQEQMFGVKESDTRQKIEKEIMDNILANLLNKGKRTTIFQNFDDDPKDLENEDSDMHMGYVVEKMKQVFWKELMEDKDAMKELKAKLLQV